MEFAETGSVSTWYFSNVLQSINISQGDMTIFAKTLTWLNIFTDTDTIFGQFIFLFIHFIVNTAECIVLLLLGLSGGNWFPPAILGFSNN